MSCRHKLSPMDDRHCIFCPTCLHCGQNFTQNFEAPCCTGKLKERLRKRKPRLSLIYDKSKAVRPAPEPCVHYPDTNIACCGEW